MSIVVDDIIAWTMLRDSEHCLTHLSCKLLPGETSAIDWVEEELEGFRRSRLWDEPGVRYVGKVRFAGGETCTACLDDNATAVYWEPSLKDLDQP